MGEEDGKRALELEEQIERKEEELTELTQELKQELEHEREHREVEIRVHDEDSGRNYELMGTIREPVNFFIEELYKKLGRERKPDDRVRCECTGADVFQYAQMNIEKYTREFCKERQWLFAGGTGGAYGMPDEG